MRMYLTAAFCCMMTLGAGAATQYTNSAPKPLSPQGLIQNVQNYSSNPFWSPDSPYNQRMPQPVYVQGLDVSTGDCQRVVSALVASYCATNNNCLDIQLDDARPTLTVQLANISGHNYVTPCAGFIDSEFKTYRDNHITAAPQENRVVAFPTASQPVTTNDAPQIQMQNPYTITAPDWLIEMKEREQELKKFQSQNSNGSDKVSKADFPTTIADVSFIDRMENATAGYKPFKDASAYQQLKLESEETYLERMRQRKEMLAQLQAAATEAQTIITPEQKQQIIAKISEALKAAQK